STVVLPSSPASSKAPTPDVARCSALHLISHSCVSKQRPARRRTINIRPQPLCAGSGFTGARPMSWLHAARTRLRLLFARRGAEARMDEEFRLHIELETEKNVRAGMDPREARRRALLAFGGVERHREAMRDGRGARWLDDLVRDLRHAARGLARTPGFTLV